MDIYELDLEALAEKLARELMINGDNKAADRLVLHDIHGRDLGGYSQEGLECCIKRYLKRLKPIKQ